MKLVILDLKKGGKKDITKAPVLWTGAFYIHPLLAKIAPIIIKVTPIHIKRVIIYYPFLIQ